MAHIDLHGLLLVRRALVDTLSHVYVVGMKVDMVSVI